MVFYQYFLEVFNLFFGGTPLAQKKIRAPFFSQNQKFRRAKICKYYFYDILNSMKIESQNHRKIAKL